MRNHNLTRQSGVVLAFSLVMLLLISLASMSMLQENSNQIRMINNLSAQNQTFADVEFALDQAETQIRSVRVSPAADATCVNPNQLSVGDTITGTTAQITATYCVYNNREYQCTGDTYAPAYNQDDPAENVIACTRLATAQCPTEVYKFNIAASNSATSSTRAIKSKFAVGCKVLL
jgi:hypothetical protein